MSLFYRIAIASASPLGRSADKSSAAEHIAPLFDREKSERDTPFGPSSISAATQDNGQSNWRVVRGGINMSERYGDDADLIAIDKVRDDHVGALNAGDADAWVAQFAEDGVQMPPNAPANVGKENIGHWSGGLLSSFRVQFGLTVDEVRVLGDWAFERGGYSIELNPAAGGPPMRDRGKYVTIYRKGAGERWQMARDIWNSDNPLPGL